MKRLDLIFSERELDAIINTLEKANVPGYTIMKHATGRGPETVSYTHLTLPTKLAV